MLENKVQILNSFVHKVSMKDSLKAMHSFINSGIPHMVVTFNTEMAVIAQKDSDLKEAIAKAELVVPDSIGILWAAKFQGQRLPERVTGVDLVSELLSMGAQEGWSFYLLGGEPGVAQEASERIITSFPGLKIAGVEHGYFNQREEAALIKKIRLARPHVLLVGMGVPKQEKWIATHLQELEVPLVIGVGGTIDVLAGRATRAPAWIRKLGLEWLYRLLRQPSRLPRAIALPKFIFLVLTDRKREA